MSSAGTPFTVRGGTQLGRIQPVALVPVAEGSWAFCLGHDQPGYTQKVVAGDFIEVSQEADFGPTRLARYFCALRASVDIPAGNAWELKVSIDGSAHTTRRLTRTRRLVDLAINTANYAPGLHTLAFRLSFIAL